MAFRPFKFTTPEFGQKDFEAALARFETRAGRFGDLITETLPEVKAGLSEAKGLRSQFRVGGTFGEGRRQTATEEIQKGLARDTAAAVAAGASSISSARGLNVLAGRERAIEFANIDDIRAQFELQAFQPYVQMLSALSNLASAGVQIAGAEPTRREFITQGKPFISGFGPAI